MDYEDSPRDFQLLVTRNVIYAKQILLYEIRALRKLCGNRKYVSHANTQPLQLQPVPFIDKVIITMLVLFEAHDVQIKLHI